MCLAEEMAYPEYSCDVFTTEGQGTFVLYSEYSEAWCLAEELVCPVYNCDVFTAEGQCTSVHITPRTVCL